MKIRLLKGVSGYRPDGSSYRYSRGSVEVCDDYVGRDLLKNGLAEPYEEEVRRPIAEPPRSYATAQSIDRTEVVQAVVKRGRKPKRNV